MLGDYLEDSGLTARAAHITRTRYGHHVCAIALSKLQQKAFLSLEALHD